MTDLTVAKTILEQLGGRQFSVMTGAKNFVGDSTSLSFRLPGGGGFTKNGINVVRVTLDPSDTYTVVFSRLRGAKLTTVATETGIYADTLREVFRLHTGLVPSFGMNLPPAGTTKAMDQLAENRLAWFLSLNNKAED